MWKIAWRKWLPGENNEVREGQDVNGNTETKL